MKVKKGFAKFLMIEAIVIFVFGLIGTCVISQEEVVEYVPTVYSWDEDEYKTTNKFNGTTFFSGLINVVTFSSLIYAASEILDKTEKNHAILKTLSRDNTEGDKEIVKENVTISNSDDINVSEWFM